MKENASPDQIVRTSEFQQLLAAKRRFIVPMTIFFLVFYFALPVMTAYSKVLNASAFGSISWAWVFAFAQFIMTWVLCVLYSRKAAKFDQMVAEIKRKTAGDGQNRTGGAA